MSQVGRDTYHCPCGADVLVEIVATNTAFTGGALVVDLAPTADTRVAMDAHEAHRQGEGE